MYRLLDKSGNYCAVEEIQRLSKWLYIKLLSELSH